MTNDVNADKRNLFIAGVNLLACKGKFATTTIGLISRGLLRNLRAKLAGPGLATGFNTFYSLLRLPSRACGDPLHNDGAIRDREHSAYRAPPKSYSAALSSSGVLFSSVASGVPAAADPSLISGATDKPTTLVTGRAKAMPCPAVLSPAAWYIA